MHTWVSVCFTVTVLQIHKKKQKETKAAEYFAKLEQ